MTRPERRRAARESAKHPNYYSLYPSKRDAWAWPNTSRYMPHLGAKQRAKVAARQEGGAP